MGSHGLEWVRDEAKKLMEANTQRVNFSRSEFDKMFKYYTLGVISMRKSRQKNCLAKRRRSKTWRGNCNLKLRM